MTQQNWPTSPKLPLPGEEILRLNYDYLIMDIEPFKSEVNGYFGFRVTLDGGKDNTLALALWYRETVGRKSKMGSFLTALGENPTSWAGKMIRFVSWDAKNRVIALQPAKLNVEPQPAVPPKKK